MMVDRPEPSWYKHQKDLIELAPAKRLVAFGCGAGKTRTTLKLAFDKGGSVLVVAPKTQVLDRTWERELEKCGFSMPLTVISKEKFKKDPYQKADILILDESHCFLGVTSSTRYRRKIEIPRTSQLFEATLAWVAENKPKAIYLCSATPFPTPLALWGVARLFGEEWDYFAFRRKFYRYVPNIGRGVWLPARDKETEAVLKQLATKFGTFGRLEDFFDVPDQTHKPITVGLSSHQKAALKELPLAYPEPLVRVGKKHQVEQGILDGSTFDEYKTEEVLALMKEFDKVLVFARYTAQIEAMAKALAQQGTHTVLTLTGATGDRRTLMEMAEMKDKKIVVIAQSQISTGYELPSFRCTVFASMSYSFVDYEQALGRTQRANNISKNVYVYLLSDEVDEAVLKCVQSKKDFNEELFTQGL